jgi:hypothetical protein
MGDAWWSEADEDRILAEFPDSYTAAWIRFRRALRDLWRAITAAIIAAMTGEEKEQR